MNEKIYKTMSATGGFQSDSWHYCCNSGGCYRSSDDH